ncbi:Surfeit locus protein 6-like protein [Frankliniella fusca]|uniref:Surfeit locus protein 6-like protein n=1 Tax=Frankliniella fusca TaxID=407009 RepID=A0AAE1HGS1_9NEOP|nr:Surfeit locus protein 6-like protein [Frankliniella fusca]
MGNSNDGADEDETTEGSKWSPNAALRVVANANKTPRASTIQELQERLEACKAKKAQGYRDLVTKKNLKSKLKKAEKKRKKADERNLKHKQMKLEPSKPVFNSEGKMVFSKFDFSEIGSHKEEKKKKKELKDPRKILEKLKEKKETLKKLKDEGQEAKVLELKQKEAWSNAFKKAEGVKIKDDPELLKKTLKREETKKKRSAKQWASREHTKKKALSDKVQKRESNIQARKDQMKNKKRAKAIKKGRIVPGF